MERSSRPVGGAAASGRAVASGRATASTRSYMSTWMLRSAMRSADHASQLEDAPRGKWGEHALLLMESVISAVISSAAFLEAMINELYSDAIDRHGLTNDGYLAPVPDETVRLMADWWNETDEGRDDRVLNKYQLALSFAGQDMLDRGTEPYQSAHLLCRLRNKLVHYRPETIAHDTVVRLERQLKDKFPPSSFLSTEQPWWPNRALGAGCATWAHESARLLSDHVVGTLGIVPNYQRVLGTKPPIE